ncbi:MAG: hypothetical protein WCX31_17865 [Salinivirgaceae bacterium]|jgi:hypothetical protein
MKRMFLIMIFGVGLIFSSCEYEAYVAPEVIVPTEPISFSEQIQPIFSNQNCTGCHTDSHASGLDLTPGNSYQSLMSNTGVVDTLNPATSLIVTIPASTGSHYKIYTAQDDLLVLTWIEEGAKNN